jgi:hypothetical protein
VVVTSVSQYQAKVIEKFIRIMLLVPARLPFYGKNAFDDVSLSFSCDCLDVCFFSTTAPSLVISVVGI